MKSWIDNFICQPQESYKTKKGARTAFAAIAPFPVYMSPCGATGTAP
jgi:hypothetical protein